MALADLESERLILEPLRIEHADELAPVLDDAALHEFIGGRPPTPDELRRRFERQVQGHSPDRRERWLNWTVRLCATGRAVGTAQATIGADGTANLAWVIGHAYQGQGLAKEAAGLMASWLRGQGVERLGARIHPRHGASIAVARSIGLVATDTTVDGEIQWQSESAPRKEPHGTRADHH